MPGRTGIALQSHVMIWQCALLLGVRTTKKINADWHPKSFNAKQTRRPPSHMPLTKPLGRPPLADPGGVAFALKDRSKIIHCRVTQTALEKLARRPIGIDELERIFHLHRDRIEAAASAKYDRSPVLRKPFVITPSDLVVPSRSRRITVYPTGGH